jgi:hypothetical protein
MYSRELTFDLTEQHVKLLRRMYVGWQDCETGAPEIDPKRPYGNSSVGQDVAEILSIPYQSDEEEGMPEDVYETMLAIHRQTELALQVVLASGSFVPGTYRRSHTYKNDWYLSESQ